MKWYVYITDRSKLGNGLYGTNDRLYVNIYEAPTKEAVKELLLADVDWLKYVKQKITKNMPEGERFITSIHEIDDYWEGIFIKPRKCLSCLNAFTKIDKLKYQTGGRSDFCSEECDREYSARLDPNSTGTWNNGTVYRIIHKPTTQFYIGVTTRWIMQRWWEHIKAESGSPFHMFMKEHPLHEFAFEVLESFKPSEQDPYEREAYWINKYEATTNGLNTASAHKANSSSSDQLNLV